MYSVHTCIYTCLYINASVYIQINHEIVNYTGIFDNIAIISEI